MTDLGDELGAVLGSWLPAWLRRALDRAPVMAAITLGADHRLVWQNLAAVEVYGRVPTGRPLRELFPDLGAGTYELWDRAFAGEFVEVSSSPVQTVDMGGRHRVMRYSLAPVGGDDGQPVGVIQFVADDTVEADAVAAFSRSQLLDAVSAAVLTADAPGAALQALTDRLVPAVADMATAYVFPHAEAGSFPEAPSPVAISLGPALADVGPPPPPTQRAGPSPWNEALLAGRGVILSVSADTLEEIAPDPTARAWLEASGTNSLAAMPLVVAGELAGGVLLLAAGTRPPYDESDMAFLSAVTSRVGAAISEVRARQRDRRTAERLQAVLLPSRPPRLPGIEVAARYLPGGVDNLVGGDWWDVADLGDVVGLGIGDISGHGLPAAAFMGQARVAMRTAGHARLGPAAVLAAVDAHLAETFDQEWDDEDVHRLATAVYAHVDLRRAHLRIASAGHPPLLVRRAGGEVELGSSPTGPPLGLRIGGYHEATVPFGPGDILVAFTDGLVEDRSVGVVEGTERLARILADARADDLERLAERLLEGMGRLGQREDDIALLVARCAGPGAGGTEQPPA